MTRKPYTWLNWSDEDILAAQSDIQRIYEALKLFEDGYADVPRPLHEAYQSLRALREHIAWLERGKIIEWNTLWQQKS